MFFDFTQPELEITQTSEHSYYNKATTPVCWADEVDANYWNSYYKWENI